MRAPTSLRPRFASSFANLSTPGFFILLLLSLAELRGVPARSLTQDAAQGPIEVSEVVGVSDIDLAKIKLQDEVTVPEQAEKKNITPDVVDIAKLEDAITKKEEQVVIEKASPVGNSEKADAEVDEEKPIELVFPDQVEDEKRKIIKDSINRGSVLLRGEDEESSVVKKRRRNDVAFAGKSDNRDRVSGKDDQKGVGEDKEEGIRRFDALVDPEANSGEKSAKVDESETGDRKRLIDVEESRLNAGTKKNGGETNHSEGSQDEVEPSEEVRNDLRSLGTIDGKVQEKEAEQPTSTENAPSVPNEEPTVNREYRYLGETQGKSRFKSSTVYLSAEEKKVFDGEQESIVDGQIKKLISIRDDALGAASDQSANVAKLEETKILNVDKASGIEEVAFISEDKNVRNGRSGKLEVEYKQPTNERLQRWKNQAATLQKQIRDKTFLARLGEQDTVVLPEIPKFTEKQLLDSLRYIVSAKRHGAPNETYSDRLSEISLTENQQKIIKCAEQLVNVKQRQSFVSNMVECISGLSVLNCMRIFVWPIVAENLPESIGQNLANLPIEINLIDLLTGNREKSGRSQDLNHVRLISPENAAADILQEALGSIPANNMLRTYIDPKNETLRKILTSNQLDILQMAERFLPESARREYSDRMYSCVRRFEYFSCIRYFAWPMVKQYFPALPPLPDYPTWYPTVTLFPDYPLVPFPSISDEVGELPEIVEADATRMRKPRPETMIVHLLQTTLKQQPKVHNSPSLLDSSMDSYVTLIPQEQLQTLHLAEQLIPVPYRPEFLQKSVRCIQEFNYLTCVKYSTWPAVRQFNPSLPEFPDIFEWIPDIPIPGLSDIFSYFPNLPSISDFTSFIPGSTPPAQPPAGEMVAAPVLVKQVLRSDQRSNELEERIIEILSKVRKSLENVSEAPPKVSGGNIVYLTALTKKEVDILKLAEDIVPPHSRTTLIGQVLTCLQRNNDFVNCTRYVIWPAIGQYDANLPEFPLIPADLTKIKIAAEGEVMPVNPGNEAVERIMSDIGNIAPKISSRNPLGDEELSSKPVPNVPVISVTDTRFVPIFTEHPESVIFNILRSVQLSSPNVNEEATPPSITKTQQFVDILNDQQESIIRITESLLPDAVRPAFVNRMIECVRESNFLLCSRDVLWPTMLEYFPRLPSFPSFGISPAAASNSTVPSSSPQNITEPSAVSDARPLAETNVKTGQHGDATVTITDTRFFPIFNELPETIILNILKAVEISTPNLPASSDSMRTVDYSKYFNEQQAHILRIAENLLPRESRQSFVDRMVACIRNNNFLECTRDIAWPTIAQYFPRLPSFPEFGSLQNLPRTKYQFVLDDKDERPALEQMENKIEEILNEVLGKERPRVDQSYLNIDDLEIGSRLTGKEVNIIRMIERGIPDPLRASYVTKMMECVKSSNFISCTQQVSWPTLKQQYPTLPGFPNFDELLSQLPSLPSYPDFGSIPSIPGAGGFPFQDGSGIPQFPAGIPQFPGGIPEFPSVISQFPGGTPSLPSFPSFGGITNTRTAQGETLPDRPDVNQQERGELSGTPASTSVADQGLIPEYPGQPSGTFIDITKEEVDQSDYAARQPKSPITELLSKIKTTRRRRGIVEKPDSFDNSDSEIGLTPLPVESTYLNMTETEFLHLLVNITSNKIPKEDPPNDDKSAFPNGDKSNAKDPPTVNSNNSQQSFVDSLNSTIKDSLTADQHEILKIVESLNEDTSNRGFLSRVVQCIRSLSFIRCMGIFVWPYISSAVPSLIGFPSLPGFLPFGRSTENEIEKYFGMSTLDFEKELLWRKESIENDLFEWYSKLADQRFETNLGFLKIRGLGNGELGISLGSFREGRGSKIKDNKNLPSILTIISDIMEEVLDQRPDTEKIKKDKDKKERSISEPRESDFQFLKDTEEYSDIQRSISDDQIITMFLDKIKPNVSDSDHGEGKQYLNREEACSAFEVLFGTRLSRQLQKEEDKYENQESSGKNANQNDSNEPKVVTSSSQVGYDFEKESARNQEERQRQKRAKNLFKSLLDKFSSKYLKDTRVERFEDDPAAENVILNNEKPNGRSELTLQLPSLNEEIALRPTAHLLKQFGKSTKRKMMQMMPGVGFVLSFLIQMALAHARAAASIAGMLSNMALGSAMFGMVRQAIFGQGTHPKIKYVYDNNDVMATWPQGHGPYYR